ncbi:acylneuraminate cytidylyltransferase [Pseudonocardia sp. H11422]|uniref:acylneuraminate cytidylyltransferase n=1 Tax=Pseudonocardia sp. H11422 TaxID=2835866 RepID=UPI001BDC1B9F|nr:acylneuraminate cytidylyltransferase [Pseudonocardia sp. H11422]
MAAVSLTVVIPVRAGSRGIPGKNLRHVGGRPLLDWVVDAALGAACVDRVLVSTDDPAIRRHVLGTAAWCDRVLLPPRAPATATDLATTESVLLDVMDSPQAAGAGDIALVQATSPLLQAADLDGAYALYRSGFDSVLSVVRQRRFRWRLGADGAAVPDYDPAARPRRQDLAGHLVENGALYITSRQALLRTRTRVSGRIGLFEMPEESYTEVDEPADLAIVDALLRRRIATVAAEPPAAGTRVRLVLTDVDGVLTDNGMTYLGNGVEAKTYSARDGKGFELLRNAGVRTGLITSEQGPQIQARADKLRVDALVMASRDKLADAIALCERWGLSLDEVAFIGDDVHDVALLERVGLAGAPADAMAAASSVADYRCRTAGGHGAFREFADVILAAQLTAEVNLM